MKEADARVSNKDHSPMEKGKETQAQLQE